MNKKHEETYYSAFDDKRKFSYVKNGLKPLHSLYVRWWLPNIKCYRSNLVIDNRDQKSSVVPSLTRLSFLDLHRCCLLLLYFVNKPFAVYYEKMRIRMHEKANNCVKLHSLATKYDHLRVNKILLALLYCDFLPFKRCNRIRRQTHSGALYHGS